jgi:hypothetical protein
MFRRNTAKDEIKSFTLERPLGTILGMAKAGYETVEEKQPK